MNIHYHLEKADVAVHYQVKTHQQINCEDNFPPVVWKSVAHRSV